MDKRLNGFIALFLIIGLLSFGCLGERTNTDASTSGNFAPAPYVKTIPGGSAEFQPTTDRSASSTDQILTKSSTASLKVPEGTLETKYTELRAMLTREGGQISNVQYNEYSNRKQYLITAKVVPGRFDQVITELKTIGDVKDLSISIEDVTKQYTDLNTRIQNKELELDRLRSIYNTTGNISDLLGVEQELARVETELDLLKGEKQYLESRISRSSIEIAVYEEKPATTSLGLSIESLGESFFGAMSGGIIVLSLIIGFLIPFSIVIGVLWWIWKKLSKKSQVTADATPAASKKK
ncbi:DUF4349 domain-containing protein [Candidatus Micrarchaeota archaeon]|nr:DUF4349 domain-containing protein [Candidatus Micrarchaeota archaeon]